mmetsp:Transcript_28032/g.50831  ORF Transcript_28032/g.50831 Transcript_28032/m.50831 type:complete len:612 (+) Transcript_28032:126-1961(+)
MAGYGASLKFDEEAMKNLPVGKDTHSTAQRRAMFRQADMSGNGITSLAECDRLIVSVLAIEGIKIMKPVINRAFHAARDIVPPTGSFSPHYVDFHEFRYFLIYLQHYLELFLLFCGIDTKDAKSTETGKYTDRRMGFPEFEDAVPRLLDWGLEDEVAETLREDPRLVFQDLDANGGGVVLFDEFAHWALWNHLFSLDGDDDDDLEEAMEVLKKQKPNLCGKDLDSIKASKAKYRADAKMSGQGCLGGDPSLAGGYERIEDGAKELVAGRHYPGGLAAWKASFHGAGRDRPGKYRTVAKITAIYANPKGNAMRDKVDQLENGSEVEVLEVIDVNPDEPRIRARIDGGYISLLNTENGFRWAVRLQDRGKFSAWKASFNRCVEADEDFMTNGVPECANGCGQPRFGRYPTCCTHCKGPDGPHARDCKPKGYEECENRCGHPQFGKYKTCCTHCRGPDGPHARGCKPMVVAETTEKEEGARSGESGAAGCSNGCGRAKFRRYPTCCTHCKGPDGPHARDCDQRHEQTEKTSRIVQCFSKIDANKDGKINRDELACVLRNLDTAGVFSDMDVNEVLDLMDTNGDGCIDYGEFALWSEGDQDSADAMIAATESLGE